MKDVNSYKVVPADQRYERGRPSGAGKDADQPASHRKSSRCHVDADDQQKMGKYIYFLNLEMQGNRTKYRQNSMRALCAYFESTFICLYLNRSQITCCNSSK